MNKKLDQLNIVLEEIEQRDNNIYRVLFETNPIPSEVRKAGFGGVNRYKNLEGYDNSRLITETTKKIEILTKQIVIQSKSLDEIERLAIEKEKLLSAIPSIQPIKEEILQEWHLVMVIELIHLTKLVKCILVWILQHQKGHQFMLLAMAK